MAIHMLLRRQPRLVPSYLGRMYSTGPGSSGRTIQTPVQSQPADAISPTSAAPASIPTSIQTPMQAQNLRNITAQMQPKARERPNDRNIVITAVVGLISVPIIWYYYYHYRKDHMEKKWKRMLEDAQQKQVKS